MCARTRVVIFVVVVVVVVKCLFSYQSKGREEGNKKSRPLAGCRARGGGGSGGAFKCLAPPPPLPPFLFLHPHKSPFIFRDTHVRS
jgi:hypothetical protein